MALGRNSLALSIGVEAATGLAWQALRRAFGWIRPWMMWVTAGWLQWHLQGGNRGTFL
jgi:hypothetical protein